ncbi:MAG TPA: hypothetical protein VIL74_13490 [Pyrinomonadaceae bacterium]|jgi:hypothetical protein
MAVVINEFEVMPEPPRGDNSAIEAKKQNEKSGAPDQPPNDYEIKQMLERRMERSERISAH